MGMRNSGLLDRFLPIGIGTIIYGIGQIMITYILTPFSSSQYIQIISALSYRYISIVFNTTPFFLSIGRNDNHTIRSA